MFLYCGIKEQAIACSLIEWLLNKGYFFSSGF